MGKQLKTLGLVASLLMGLLSAHQVYAQAEAYKIDNAHSFANWKIRHVASKVSGTFSDVNGVMMIDQKDLSKSSVEATINVMSVNSSHAKRDAHIKKADYLDAANYAQMHFKSIKIDKISATEGIMIGSLTLRGVTKEIAFPFKVLGFAPDPWGGYRTGVEAHAVIKASDYGFGWGLKPNGPVGDEIEITLLIEGIKNK